MLLVPAPAAPGAADLHDAAITRARRARINLSLEHAHCTRVYLLAQHRVVYPETAVCRERLPARHFPATVAAVHDTLMTL